MFDSMFPSHWSTLRKLMWLKLKGASAVWETISGNPVSFTALAAPLRKLSIAFSPVQDLHGQDAPWPAGGGKNKVNLIDGSYTIGVSGVTADVSNGSVALSGTSSNSGGRTTRLSEYFTLTAGTYVISPQINANPYVRIYINKKVDDSPLGYNTSFTIAEETEVYLGIGVEGSKTYNVTVKPQVESGTTPSAWSPYSNECPISGWDSLGVEQRGVNMWDEEWETGAYSTVDGTPTPNSTQIRCKNLIPVAPNETYYIHVPSTTGIKLWVSFYDADGVLLTENLPYGSGSPANNARQFKNVTCKMPAACHSIKFYVTAEYGNTYNNDISINYPSTDHEYHPYNPSSRSISISLGSTVYSGWVDAVTGIGEVTWAYFSKPLSDAFVVTTRTNTVRYRFENVFANTVARPAISNIATHAYNADDVVHFYVEGRNADIFVPIGTSTDTVVQVCAPLATPIPIQLTPQEINSLAGDNTMFTSCDSLTVEYRSN